MERTASIRKPVREFGSVGEESNGGAAGEPLGNVRTREPFLTS